MAFVHHAEPRFYAKRREGLAQQPRLKCHIKKILPPFGDDGAFGSEEGGRGIVLGIFGIDRGGFHLDQVQGIAVTTKDVDPRVEFIPQGRGFENDGGGGGEEQLLRAGEGARRIALMNEINAGGVLGLGDRLDHEAAVGEKFQVFVFVEIRRVTVLPVEKFGPTVAAGFEVGFGKVGAGHGERGRFL